MEDANLSRRALLAAGTLACTAAAAPAATPARIGDPWARLLAGNTRFATGRSVHPRQDPAWRRRLVDGQQPFACVLGCADSRVPVELLFDQGLGDLFTVRATPAGPDHLAACVRNQARRIAAELPRRSGMIDTAGAEIIPAVHDLASGFVRRVDAA
jgi:hypothetical protein